MAYQMSTLEQNIYRIVKEFGFLRVEQAYTINYGQIGATRTRRKKAISNLIVRHRVFYSKNKDYLLLNPMVTPSVEVSDAMLVAIGYARSKLVDLTGTHPGIYRPEKPLAVGFRNKNGKFFEVAVPAGSGKEPIEACAGQIQMQYDKQQIERDERFIRYIFLLKHLEDIKYFPKESVTYPYAFAVMNYVAQDGISLRKVPEITYHVPALDHAVELEYQNADE